MPEKFPGTIDFDGESLTYEDFRQVGEEPPPLGFPASVNSYVEEQIRRAVTAVEESDPPGSKVVVIDVPPGVGKSWAVVGSLPRDPHRKFAPRAPGRTGFWIPAGALKGLRPITHAYVAATHAALDEATEKLVGDGGLPPRRHRGKDKQLRDAGLDEEADELRKWVDRGWAPGDAVIGELARRELRSQDEETQAVRGSPRFGTHASLLTTYFAEEKCVVVDEAPPFVDLRRVPVDEIRRWASGTGRPELAEYSRCVTDAVTMLLKKTGSSMPRRSSSPDARDSLSYAPWTSGRRRWTERRAHRTTSVRRSSGYRNTPLRFPGKTYSGAYSKQRPGRGETRPRSFTSRSEHRPRKVRSGPTPSWSSPTTGTANP